MNYPVLPSQFKGSSHDIVSMHCANTLKKARNNYEILKHRLQAVNKWHTFSEKIRAEFFLVNPNTFLETTSFSTGNLVKIDIPGPPSPSGKGYDWTEITEIQEDENDDNYQFYAFTLRPCANPETKSDTISHFYNAEATNTFVIRRLGNCIYIEAHGRNQTENTSDVPLLDQVRNKAIAVGSKLGLGSLNWLGFTSALLEPLKR